MPSLNTLGLACSPDPHYFILLGVPREDGHFLGHTKRRCGHFIGHTWAWHIAKPNRVRIWLAPYPTFPGLGTLPSPITLGSGYCYIQRFWSLAHCQALSCLGLASARPSMPRAGHIAKPNVSRLGTIKPSASSLRRICFFENLYL